MYTVSPVYNGLSDHDAQLLTIKDINLQTVNHHSYNIRNINKCSTEEFKNRMGYESDRLCGLVVRVLGYRSGSPSSILGTTRKKKVVGLERGSLSLVSTTEELLDRKVAAPV
jgi:hypothetical protein